MQKNDLRYLKGKIATYIVLRLIILAFGLTAIYRFTFSLLPANIQDDQFSFISELNLIVKLMLGFSFAYCTVIYLEYRNFRKREQYNLKKAALVLFVLSGIIFCTSLFLSFKLQ